MSKVQQEEERLTALRSANILDTPPEECFDRITRLARAALQAPMALISLVDRERQWFKSRQGISIEQTHRSISFCSHAVEQDTPLVVPDALLDHRFSENPLVVGGPNIRSYLGAQLKTSNGLNIGTLCILDTRPRCYSGGELAILQDLAQLAMESVKLRLLATTDVLTGCATRRAFEKNAHEDFFLAQQTQKPLSCLLLDIDFFKKVNDVHGHAAGDRVLRKLVSICRPQLRESDYVGRLGGEEFAIILLDTSASMALEIAERLRVLIESEVFSEFGNPFSVTASMGIAEMNDTISKFDELLERADEALYLSKTQGRNRVSVSDATDARMRARTVSIEAVKDDVDPFSKSVPRKIAPVSALTANSVVAPAAQARSLNVESLRAYFQPIADLRTDEIVGFEALARLEMDGELIAPAGFLSCLGQEDLFRLFAYMVGSGLEVLRSKHDKDYYVTINLETSLLLAETFLDKLQSSLNEYGFSGENLIFELLEGDQITDFKNMNDVLNKVRALGISVALDDIGSGYSSLIVLRDIPVDIIKLDKSFALGLHEKPEALRFVHNVLSLARGLGKKLIVEGIETFAIQDAMRVLGVEFGQGFAIARPMPRAAIGLWLAQRRSKPLGRTPLTLLGAYAGHLAVVESCRVLMHQAASNHVARGVERSTRLRDRAVS